jgi:hypothetical protein
MSAQKPGCYMRYGGTTTLVSGGSYTPPDQIEHPVELDALHPTAKQVVFDAAQTLNYEDHDGTGPDVYQWYYGKTILSSQGPSQPYFPPPDPAEFLAFAPVHLGVVFFSTAERLLPEDTDTSPDIYERELESPDQTHIYRSAGGTTRSESLSLRAISGPYAPTFHAVSRDGSRVLFTTAEQLVDEDTDSSVDLYERFGGYTTRLLSAGQINGNGPFDFTARGDGERPLFTTSEQLVPGDTDSEPDLYERIAGRTHLLSTGKPAPPAPVFQGSEPASPANVNDPAIRGAAEQSTTVELFSTPSCSGSPLASGSAAEFASPGLTVHVSDNSTSSFYARATDSNENTGPCSDAFAYVEDSTPPAAPVLSSIDPAGPANDNAPRIKGSAGGETTVRIFGAPACAGKEVGDGSAADLAGAGITATVADDTKTTFSANATDAAGNLSACAGSLTYLEDSTPPETRIEAGPGPRTKRRRATF